MIMNHLLHPRLDQLLKFLHWWITGAKLLILHGKTQQNLQHMYAMLLKQAQVDIKLHYDNTDPFYSLSMYIDGLLLEQMVSVFAVRCIVSLFLSSFVQESILPDCN